MSKRKRSKARPQAGRIENDPTASFGPPVPPWGGLSTPHRSSSSKIPPKNFARIPDGIMTDTDFNAIVHARSAKIVKILASKAKEYARGDRLSNFKKAAAAMGTTPERACLGFWMKHVISIADLVNDLDAGKVAGEEMWQEKIGDAINYLVLLEAIVSERV